MTNFNKTAKMQNRKSYFQDVTEFIIKNKPDKKQLTTKKMKLCKKHKLKTIPTDIEILLSVKEKDIPKIKS